MTLQNKILKELEYLQNGKRYFYNHLNFEEISDNVSKKYWHIDHFEDLFHGDIVPDEIESLSVCRFSTNSNLIYNILEANIEGDKDIFVSLINIVYCRLTHLCLKQIDTYKFDERLKRLEYPLLKYDHKGGLVELVKENFSFIETYKKQSQYMPKNDIQLELF